VTEVDSSPARIAELTERGRRLVTYAEDHKGGITLSLSALLYLSSLAVSQWTAWPITGSLLRSTGEAALVGGMCDYIAIKMIFERRWYLPNSGVLPRNRQKLIDGIAATIESQWLTPQMIGTKLHELDLVKRLGRYLETLSVGEVLDRPQFARLCERIAEQVDSKAFVEFVEERMRASATRPIKVAHSVGLFSYHDLSMRVGKELSSAIAGLPTNEQLLSALETRLHYLGEELQQRDSPTRETAYRLMDMLVEHAVIASRGQITHTVKENLSRLSDDEIRRQIESRTRTHLDWIRVNGGMFGALFGLAFGLLNFLFAHHFPLSLIPH
jgi:uncharacterized membrane-anchored protein YjiN (DUF445 family)